MKASTISICPDYDTSFNSVIQFHKDFLNSLKSNAFSAYRKEVHVELCYYLDFFVDDCERLISNWNWLMERSRRTFQEVDFCKMGVLVQEQRANFICKLSQIKSTYWSLAHDKRKEIKLRGRKNSALM